MLIAQIANGLYQIHTTLAMQRLRAVYPPDAAILMEHIDAVVSAIHVMNTLAEHGVHTVNDLPLRLTPSGAGVIKK